MENKSECAAEDMQKVLKKEEIQQIDSNDNIKTVFETLHVFREYKMTMDFTNLERKDTSFR